MTWYFIQCYLIDTPRVLPSTLNCKCTLIRSTEAREVPCTLKTHRRGGLAKWLVKLLHRPTNGSLEEQHRSENITRVTSLPMHASVRRLDYESMSVSTDPSP